MDFYEAIWFGEGIGDGADLEEALHAYIAVKPDDGNWVEACAAKDANPHVQRFASFDAYLDNADALESIDVSAEMIASALEQHVL